jgi:hypothetical protein
VAAALQIAISSKGNSQMKRHAGYLLIISLLTLCCSTISSHADPQVIGKIAGDICSGSQDIDFESSTGNAKYKDLKLEITDAGKTLKLKNKGVLLAQVTDFTFAKYQECLQVMIKALGEIKDQPGIEYHPIPFSHSASSTVFVTKVSVSTDSDAVVRIKDGTCNMWVWVAQCVVDDNAPGKPIIDLAMPQSGRYVTNFPFEYRITRWGSAVDDAGFGTRAALGYTQDQKQQFIQFALSRPDNIKVWLVIRPSSPDCTGYYSIASDSQIQTNAH